MENIESLFLLIISPIIIILLINSFITGYHNTIHKKKDRTDNMPSKKTKRSILNYIYESIHKLSNCFAEKKQDKSQKKLLIMKLEISFTLLLTMIAPVISKKYLSDSDTKISTDISNLKCFSVDFYWWLLFVFSFFIIIYILLVISNYLTDYSIYGYGVFFTWVVILITLVKFRFKINYDYIFIVYYFVSLPIIYSFIKYIKKIGAEVHSWLYEKKKKNMDPEKLMFIWTILVFILGLLFNIK